jgi:Zn finger protein HypA/HybF involved in hydrogenase expression
VSASARLILCPQCQHTFPPPQGTVTACPRCGKIVMIRAVESAPAPPAIPVELQATLPVVCKLCNSRYYAKPVEMGKILKCPDCHTGNMVVPILDKKILGGVASSSAIPTQPTPQPEAPTSFTAPSNAATVPHDDDELKLSEPIEVAPYRTLAADNEHLESYLREMQRLSGGNKNPASPANPEVATPEATTPPVAPSPPNVGPTLATAYAEDSFSGVGVGARVNAPYPAVPTPPKPAPRSWKVDDLNAAVEVRQPPPAPDAPAREARESSPAPNIAAPSSVGTHHPAIGWDKRYPFTSGIIEIFQQGQVLSRWFTVALLVAAQIFMLTIVDKKSLSEDASEMVAALFIVVVLVFSVIPTVMAMSSFTLAIFEDTANGENMISSWPEFSFLELFQGSLYILGSLTITGIPGLIMALFFYDYVFYDDSRHSMILSIAFGSLFILLSCFIFFPVVFTSMLETGSVGEPISTTILKSFRTMFSRWMMFYFVGTLLTIILLGTIFVMIALIPYLNIFIIIPASGIITACPIVYMRLLGRLAMLYRDHLAELEEQEFAKVVEN